MSIADTSFLIRAIEFKKLTDVESNNEISITEEVENELNSKDAETIREDYERVTRLIGDKPFLSQVEFVDLSSIELEISSLLKRFEGGNFEIGSDYEKLLKKYDLPTNLEKGELTCAICCKERDADLLIDDFIAYSTLYADLDGRLSCLCEQIIQNSEKDSIEDQKIVTIIENLFVPYEDMNLTVKANIRRQIEGFLDSEFNDLTRGT